MPSTNVDFWPGQYRASKSLYWVTWKTPRLERSHEYETIWPGAVDRETFDIATDRLIERYFGHPSYYTIDGKPVFSIYELGTLVEGLGGMEATRDALDSLRARVCEAGFPGLHIQAMLWGNIPESVSMVPGVKRA